MFQSIPQRICRRCRFVAQGDDEIALWFRRSGKSRLNFCDGCRADLRDGPKQINRFTAKARQTFNRHATKYIKQGLANDPGDFALKFGWDVKRIAHEMEHAYGNGCSECGLPYEPMGHGPADITVDIWDPRLPPEYGVNTRLICSTDNQQKGDLIPELWAVKKALWRRWKKWIADHPLEPPPEQLALIFT